MDKIPFDPYDFFGYLASGIVIVLGMELGFGFPSVLGNSLTAVETAVLILASYVAGQVIATPAKWILENLLVARWLKRPATNLLLEKGPRVRSVLFPGYYEPLPRPARRLLREARGSQRDDLDDESFFQRLRYDPRVLSNERLMTKLDQFVSKYGFARNLSFTCLLVGIVLLLSVLANDHLDARRYGITAIIISVSLFYRYLKFFRQYSFELFNTYAGLDTAHKPGTS